MSIRRAKKSKKIEPWSLKGRNNFVAYKAQRINAPRLAANYQRNTRKKQQRLRRRSNTPLGRWPGEFVYPIVPNNKTDKRISFDVSQKIESISVLHLT